MILFYLQYFSAALLPTKRNRSDHRLACRSFNGILASYNPDAIAGEVSHFHHHLRNRMAKALVSVKQ